MLSYAFRSTGLVNPIPRPDNCLPHSGDIRGSLHRCGLCSKIDLDGRDSRNGKDGGPDFFGAFPATHAVDRQPVRCEIRPITHGQFVFYSEDHGFQVCPIEGQHKHRKKKQPDGKRPETDGFHMMVVVGSPGERMLCNGENKIQDIPGNNGHYDDRQEV